MSHTPRHLQLRPSLRPALAALLAAAVFAPVLAAAGPEGKDPAAASATSAATPASAPAGLGGPKVPDRDVPGVTGSIDGRSARRTSIAIPHGVFAESLRSVIGPESDSPHKMSAEQAEKVRALVESAAQAARAYQREHREEIRDLERKLGRGGRGGGAGGAGEEGMQAEVSDAERARLQERVRELRAGAPNLDDTRTQVWALLTEEQRAAVDAKLAEYRARETEKQNEAYVRRRVNQQTGGGSAATPPARPQRAGPGEPSADDAARVTPEQRERFLRLLDRMTPEQRERLMQRLEQLAREAGDDARPAAATPPSEPRTPPARPAARPAPRRPARNDAPKAPPAMDEVAVPTPG